MPSLESVHIAGFKSIRDQTVELRNLNVLIGANGAGKSNFVDVFRIARELSEGRLQFYVTRSGGASRLFHHGPKVTEKIRLEYRLCSGSYRCRLELTADEQLAFAEEEVRFGENRAVFMGGLESEARGFPLLTEIRDWRMYHFQDTSESATVLQLAYVDDNRGLRADGGNLAAYLYLMRQIEPKVYRNIVETIRLAAPFFHDFDLHPSRLQPDKIKLEWLEQGSDAYFDASALSDGTLRFMALATLLLQPEPPELILLDEPELGLHPYAIHLLAAMLNAASERTQLIVSTQSVTLVNQLTPEDVIIVDREDGASTFRRPREEDIASWLDDYALGELWEKNLIGGRPG